MLHHSGHTGSHHPGNNRSPLVLPVKDAPVCVCLQRVPMSSRTRSVKLLRKKQRPDVSAVPDHSGWLTGADW